MVGTRDGSVSSQAHAVDPCLEPFLKRREPLSKSQSKEVRAFYANQNNMIDDFVALHESRYGGGDEDEIELKGHWYDLDTPHKAAVVSIVGNVAVLAMKAVTVVLSGSLAIISTLVDSALDLLSGAVFFFVGRSMRRRSAAYPVGKSRYEPLAVIFVATVMGTAAVQVIILSVQALIAGPSTPSLDTATIVLLVVSVGLKMFMFAVCRRIATPSTAALAADHLNDMISNAAALLSVIVAHYWWVYGDSLGAILVSLFIIFNWSRQGMVHVRNLAGHTAAPEMLQKVTFVALHHSDEIVAIEAVRGYGFGTELLVEVDVVLPITTPLYEAHDIGESLQWKLEHIDGVERAFVHIDYTVDQPTTREHRDVYDSSPESMHADPLSLGPAHDDDPDHDHAQRPVHDHAHGAGDDLSGGVVGAIPLQLLEARAHPSTDTGVHHLDHSHTHGHGHSHGYGAADGVGTTGERRTPKDDQSHAMSVAPALTAAARPRRAISESGASHHTASDLHTAALHTHALHAPPHHPATGLAVRHHWRSIGAGHDRALLPPIHSHGRPPSRRMAPPLAHWGPLTPSMPHWAALVPPPPPWAPITSPPPFSTTAAAATTATATATDSPPRLPSDSAGTARQRPMHFRYPPVSHTPLRNRAAAESSPARKRPTSPLVSQV